MQTDFVSAQSILNIFTMSGLAACGWFARQLWDSVQALKRDIHQIEVDLPTNYVNKSDFSETMRRIEDIVQRIYDKIDAKQDK